ncbi:3-oxoacyl-ACP synthase III family protein [Kitasatospora aureofaciens]|uniref:3-oxoacyl-ACP synthase III family protein n=1 Tax=Kitasatospora aureofaciens TaxID=1894 RepID=UPI001C4887B7|nr:3-oxoacyl-[acyl-carrier-protein] synthase III C-terminal domain-containing protein [Kitasatospora aureofaciens]MBV6698882.1 3-oxoacyl-ACP synthase [Kitasatospora aureofaciens]
MGITDFALTTGSAKVTVDDLARESGCDLGKLTEILPAGRLSALGPGESSWSLGRDAAAKVLARNGVSPDDVGLVIYAGSSEWGTPFWSPAAKIALELGVHHAHCYEVSNFCNAAPTAFRIADEQVRTGACRYALVIVADRLSQLVDRPGGLVELFNFADGAAAVLVSAENPRYELLGSANRTDPAFVDLYYGEIRDNEVKVFRRDGGEGLGEAFITNFTVLTHQVLAAVGRSLDDVAYLLVTHGNQNTQRQLLDTLGLPHERSVFNYEVEGHLGGADPLLALEDLERAERLKPGDLVLLATAGSGFTWGVTAIQVV